MAVKSLDLAWIVVKDLKKAVKFYTEVVGLQLKELHEEFGWAELRGEDGGAFLGIAQANPSDEHKPGDNAFVTFTVEDIERTKQSMLSKGAHCVGDVQEVPGHVKLQMIADSDGNQFQIVQKF